MARMKVQVNLSELQGVINDLEAKKLYNSPSQLFADVAETDWGRTNGVSAGTVYNRLQEANVDPENPVVTMRTKPGRRSSGVPRGESRRASSAASALQVSFSGWDLLVNAFQARGVEVTDVRSLMTAEFRTYEENRAILLAWGDLRRVLGCTVIKKQVSEDESIQEMSEDEVQESQDETQVGEMQTEMLPPYDVLTGSVEVIETAPDGRVLGERHLGSDTTSVESDPVAADSESMSEPEPTTITRVVPLVPAQARPAVMRPQPVRSSVPPRPQPVPARAPVPPTRMS